MKMTPSWGSRAQIRKMAEKFKRSPSVDAEEDVAKRTFDVDAGLIKVRYHYGQDRVTASFRTYAKDGSGHSFVQVDPCWRRWIPGSLDPWIPGSFLCSWIPASVGGSLDPSLCSWIPASVGGSLDPSLCSWIPAGVGGSLDPWILSLQ